MTPPDSIARGNRLAAESLLTPAELRAAVQREYDDTGRIPGRRFRVEGTSLGNSRLLTKKAAEKTMTRYGGRIAEYRPLTRGAAVRMPRGGSHDAGA